MNTAGWVTQGKPNTDAQIFISALDSYASCIANNGAPGAGSGLIWNAVSRNPGWGSSVDVAMLSFTDAASAAFRVDFNLSNLLRRLGVLQSNNFTTNTSQEAFGTANGPGPSAVSGTSGPSGFGADSVVPPIAAANLPTLIGSVAGAIAKGIQVNSIDVLYVITGADLTALNLTPVTGVFPLGINQEGSISDNFDNTDYDFTGPQLVHLASGTKMSRVRVPIVPPNGMIIDDGGAPIVMLNGTLGAGSTFFIMGIFLNCSYNFN